MTAEAAALPGVIVVADRSIHEMLRDSGASWNVQERQRNVGAMWDALSGGRLDSRSRILVFADSSSDVHADQASRDLERKRIAQAVAVMAVAGARIFVANWKPDDLPTFQEEVSQAARAQGADPNALAYTVLPVREGARACLDMMRQALVDEVTFPDDLPASVNRALDRDGVPTAATAELQVGLGPARPKLPPITAAGPVELSAPASDLPAAASMELLGRPKIEGQTTITVTSAKGGSGKSTVSVLLAGMIAKSSRDAGRPLSVCLIDLDTRDGQVASLIGQFMPTALNIRVQPIWDEERIRRNLVPAPELGISTLLAPIRPRTADTVGPDFYRTIVRSLQRMFDVVVMDTSVQYLDPLIADVALVEADEILFVTTLASTAVQGMARALREITTPIDESGLGIPREKIGIVVNQSVANVGMERDQILAAGLGVPVVGVVPLATRDVLTATNFNRMHILLDHPLIGPTYNELARACLPHQALAEWAPSADAHFAPQSASAVEAPVAASASTAMSPLPATGETEPQRRRGLFRR